MDNTQIGVFISIAIALTAQLGFVMCMLLIARQSKIMDEMLSLIEGPKDDETS